ncbi:FecCD family ABC transporter permease [Allostreptomyces psammosilenae]|uniref:Iron complex transport system permease protein n=1 Tax=Allostreptomyces psammosilenae TaxID=1892865 RepID=A0A853A1Q4_9ACTN|nr:iron chelate uptake ABC transporter family permease subunit [Allostreptomyces psammosilenae]NYI07380.1 iron complex transport system permease protein [Allostreptomyces psammosilenae]
MSASTSTRPPARRRRLLRVGPLAVPVDRRGTAVGAALAGCLVAVGLLTMATGDLPVAPADVLRTVFGRGEPVHEFVVMRMRLPRLLTGLEVGAALGLSGAIFQSLTRNPLGSPDVIGFTYGSVTGALVAILLLGTTAAGVLAGASIAGGLLTAVLVYLLSHRRGTNGFRLVLVGLGVSAVLMALNDYLMTRASLEEASAATVWMVGSLNARGWEHVVPVAVALAVLVPCALLLSRPLALLRMGDDTATSLGVPVHRTRLALLVVGTALAAVATASAGPIRFVALAAPQLARRLTGAPGPGPVTSALTGAVLVVCADWVAQRALAPTSLPVGVATAALGGVYLLWLLVRERREGRI